MQFQLQRDIARRFRTVARKSEIRRPRGPEPPIRITVANGQINLFAHLGEVDVSLSERTDQTVNGTAVVSMAVFNDRDPVIPIKLEPIRNRRSSRDAEEPQPPSMPETMADANGKLVSALHEASKTASREESRYTMSRVQVRGTLGQVNGTNGHEGLIQGGFVFPFSEDLLVPAVPVFGQKELGSFSEVRIGRTESHLAVTVGPWTVWMLIDKEGRFPDITAAIPRARMQTTIEVNEIEAAEIVRVLERLSPPADQDPGVTFDLGKSSYIRALEPGQSQPVTIPLIKSAVDGPDLVTVAKFSHFCRALLLGFRQFRFTGAERPWVALDELRTYLSASMSSDCAIRTSTAAETSQSPSALNNRLPSSFKESPVLTQPSTNGHVNGSRSEEAIDLVAEAETLRSTLQEAHTKAGRLIAVLRGYRKERRSVENALASLRSLRM